MKRALGAVLTLSLAFLSLGVSPITAVACKLAFPASAAPAAALQARGPIAITGAPVDASTALAPGQRVQIEWRGQWWRGEVLALLPDGRVAIHYTGWEAHWDEIVGRSRLRRGGIVNPAPTRQDAGPGPIVSQGTPVSAATLLSVGQAVEVLWQGTWWRGRVLASGAKGAVRIRYVGWGSGWDEWVPRARLRVRHGVAA